MAFDGAPPCGGGAAAYDQSMNGARTVDGSGELERLVARTEGFQPWRRVFHAASGVSLALGPGLAGLDRAGVLTVVGGLLAAAWCIDVARLAVPRWNELFFRTLFPLASPREARGPASSSWYLLGVLLVWALFPTVAVPAVLVLGLADPAASLVGRRWGRRRLGKGTVEGAATFFAVSLAVLLVTIGGGERAVLVALVVTVAELLPLPLDDNLTVPLMTAAALGALGP